MKPFAVTTITCNPTIDLSSEAEKVVHTSKTRTVGERMDPGGGGINVARVLHRLGIGVEALFLGGGVTGSVLDALLEGAGIPRRMLPIAGDTRLGLTVHERSTGHEYRFVPEGPCVSEDEWQSLLHAARSCSTPWLVLSGSIPRCAPPDLFAQLAKQAPEGTRVLLDSSRAPLAAALAVGRFFLVKPSLSELAALTGADLSSHQEIARAAVRLVNEGKAENVAVTLGDDGAMLIWNRQASFLPSVQVEARSAVGAGDSFLAALTAGLVRGEPPEEAFRFATAAGAASVLTPGTGLCHPEDIAQLITRVGRPEAVRF